MYLLRLNGIYEYCIIEYSPLFVEKFIGNPHHIDVKAALKLMSGAFIGVMIRLTLLVNIIVIVKM